MFLFLEQGRARFVVLARLRSPGTCQVRLLYCARRYCKSVLSIVPSFSFFIHSFHLFHCSALACHSQSSKRPFIQPPFSIIRHITYCTCHAYLPRYHPFVNSIDAVFVLGPSLFTGCFFIILLPENICTHTAKKHHSLMMHSVVVLLSLAAATSASMVLHYVVPSNFKAAAAGNCTLPSEFVVTNFTTYTDKNDDSLDTVSFDFSDPDTAIQATCWRNSTSTPSGPSKNRYSCSNPNIAFIYQTTGVSGLTIAERACPSAR